MTPITRQEDLSERTGVKKDRRTILIVDDDEKILFAFQEVLKKDGHRSTVARDGEEALRVVTSQHPDAVIMDITMPRLDGLEALGRIKTLAPSTPVILITGFGTMQTAIKAMQLGAFDYLSKPLDVDAVRTALRRALSSSAVPGSGDQVTFQSLVTNRYEIVGNSAGMQEVYKLIGSISTTPVHTSVLIFGESGTGKELVARAIHANSGNAMEPFVPINCTALPEALLESELFGYEKGAFTGAGERKPGKFDVAGRGTIFLDEIGTLALPLQQKLLRVLQEREYEPVGGNTPQQVGARFIAATNQDLAEAVRQKTFRNDLYFRLNVVAIHLPPLRDRKDDIPSLARHFLAKYNEQLKKQIRGFSEDALRFLQEYDFPGNVRELENLLERAVMLTKGELILPDALTSLRGKPAGQTSIPIVSPVFSTSRTHVLNLFEQQFLVQLLREHGGNVTAAATASRMTRQNFQRLMKKYRLESPRFKR